MAELLVILPLVLAVPGVVDVFARAGLYIWEKAGDAGPQKIREFAISYVDRGEERKCLEIAEDLYCDTLDQDLKKKIEAFVKQLRGGLFDIDHSLDELRGANFSRTKQSAIQEKALRTIEGLKNTTLTFRTFLQLEVTARLVRSRLELNSNKFRIAKQSPGSLAYTVIMEAKVDIELTTQKTSGLKDCVLEERIFRGNESRETAYNDIKELGRTLAVLGESAGVLPFAGFQILPQVFPADLSIRLVFLFPKGYNCPRSLRELLLLSENNGARNESSIPRNFRFVLPKQLARAVFSVHSRNLVHKDLRPETFLHFDDMSSDKFPKKIGNVYLTGWQAHTVGHDIYSLGVCLLELGLWESLVKYGEDGIAKKSTKLLEYEQLWRTENPTEAASLSSAEVERMAFLKMGAQPLAYEMGTQYSTLVLMCLTCLERGFGNSQQFADNESDDWKEQGVQFIQRVIQDLHRASQMDFE